ncbi:MAG: hypothetical protein ACT4O5_09580 [Gammaproteobacteria bacterium]
MDSSDEIKRLLTETRDAQREHLAAYRRVAERSVALQEQAFAPYVRAQRRGFEPERKLDDLKHEWVR